MNTLFSQIIALLKNPAMYRFYLDSKGKPALAVAGNGTSKERKSRIGDAGRIYQKNGDIWNYMQRIRVHMDQCSKRKEYKNSLAVRNLSCHTIRAYLFAVDQFFRMYPEVTPMNLLHYKIYLLEHYKPRTVKLRIHGMNSFLKYIGWTEDYICQIKIQQPISMDRVISEGDYEYLKKQLLRDRQYFYYFLVRFMAATGARVNEVVQFTAEDVQKGYKNIYSKGNKVRRIYIPSRLQEDTLRWLKQKNGYIFVNQSGERISASGIRKQLKKLAVSYQLDKSVVYPHSFRHRFARNFIERCNDLALLSNLLGHGSLETTRIYLKRNSQEQKLIVNQTVDW